VLRIRGNIIDILYFILGRILVKKNSVGNIGSTSLAF